MEEARAMEVVRIKAVERRVLEVVDLGGDCGGERRDVVGFGGSSSCWIDGLEGVRIERGESESVPILSLSLSLNGISLSSSALLFVPPLLLFWPGKWVDFGFFWLFGGLRRL